MTPGELNKIRAAVAEVAAALLARDSNAETTAEDMAEELANSMIETMVSAYEEIQAQKYNLVVVAQFELDGERFLSAVGPLSTRATQRARGVGERFAWDYKTRTGEGRYTLVPLVRNPNEAWDEARVAGLTEYEHHLSSITPGVETSYEPMRLGLPDETRARITADWQMDPGLLAKLGPHCLCGRYTFAKTTHLGDEVTPGCPRHPKGAEER